MSEKEDIRVCPTCDSNQHLRYRPGNYNPEGYYCDMCDVTVAESELVTRAPRSAGSRSGLAKELVDMDPDEL